MYKALFKKKFREFRKGGGFWQLGFLLLVSFLPLLRLWFNSVEAMFLPLGLLMFTMWMVGVACAAWAFQGDFVNQANLFLEYLPVKLSAIWLANYLSGLALLCVGAITLLWLEAMLSPWFFDRLLTENKTLSDLQQVAYLRYLCPGRLAAVITCGSCLFWIFSVLVFPAAYLEKKEQQAPNPLNGVLALAALIGLPITIIVTLRILGVTPSGLALSPVLLISGLLFSTGSYLMFALVPKHISRIKRDFIGWGLFLTISALLVGQLYLRHLTWRTLDTSLPFRVQRVYTPQLEDSPDLLLAEVESFRSGTHCVSLDVKNATFHDLGRDLQFIHVAQNKSGYLYFAYPSNRSSSSGTRNLLSIAPDGTKSHSFRIPGELNYDFSEQVRFLPQKGLIIYPARFGLNSRERDQIYLCVANLQGELLKKYRIQDWYFMVNDDGQALALSPKADEDEAAPSTTTATNAKPYMLIDLESGSSHHFSLPGEVLCFSKDLKRVICSRTRIRNGQCYTSVILIELSTMAERQLLAEDDSPAEAIKYQMDLTPRPNIVANDNVHRVNNSFEAMLWVKQRVDGELFRYSILLVDLDNGSRQIVVPETALPTIPVVAPEGTGEVPHIQDFTVDGAGFTYMIGQRIYLCDIKSRKTILLADQNIHLDAAEKIDRTSPRYGLDDAIVSSLSGRKALRYVNFWLTQSEGHPRQSTAIYVFRNEKPSRIYTGQRFIGGAIWLNNESIVFHDSEEVYVLQASGGPPQRIFPPIKGANSQ